MFINNELKNEIKKYSLENKPNEVCGFILKKNNELVIYKGQNISNDKENFCVLSPLDYIRATKKGKVLAHFHSQKERYPSLLDNINAYNHNIYSIIYSWYYDSFSVIEPKLKDYLSRPYKIGESDCYSLIRDYFKNELNIKIKNYNRNKDWWKENPDLIIDNFKNEGGILVSFGDIKKNDLIVFEIGGYVSHFSVYLGNNFILHHPENENSVINELSEALKKRIALIIRHKSLFSNEKER